MHPIVCSKFIQRVVCSLIYAVAMCAVQHSGRAPFQSLSKSVRHIEGFGITKHHNRQLLNPLRLRPSVIGAIHAQNSIYIMIEALQNLTKIICTRNIIINLRLGDFSRYEKTIARKREMTSQYDDQISQNQTVNHTPERSKRLEYMWNYFGDEFIDCMTSRRMAEQSTDDNEDGAMR